MGSLRDQFIDDQLRRIYVERGRVDRQTVVDVARAEDDPLHAHFEWDDAIAGEAHRLEQAGQLIRSVRTVYAAATETDAAKTVRSWHAVRSNIAERTHVYEPVDVVAQDPFKRAVVLREMEREWKAFKRRYSNFAEFLDLVRQDLDAEIA